MNENVCAISRVVYASDGWVVGIKLGITIININACVAAGLNDSIVVGS